MQEITHTYALRAEANFTPNPIKGEGNVLTASEYLPYANKKVMEVNALILANYNILHPYYGHSVRVLVVGFFVFILIQTIILN